jgi:DNA-binding CsgD family transcriptional regulator
MTGVPPWQGIPLSNGSIEVMSRVAGIVSSSGPVEDRVEEVLDELHRVFPFDAGIVSTTVPRAGTDDVQRRPVVSRGYQPAFVDYLLSPDWERELIEPFGMPRTGWPLREVDLPIDPMTLRGIAEYGRPMGLFEGMLSALHTPDGHHAGFLMLSGASMQAPSDEACAVVGRLSSALANLIDPLQSARVLVTVLETDSGALALQPDGGVVVLRAAPDGAPAPEGAVRLAADRVLSRGRRTGAFLWPRPDGGWYACRAFRCRDGLIVLTHRDAGAVFGLTRRELEVLTSLTSGDANSEIADQLSVTTRTVRAHVEHIMTKLEAGSRSAAVSRALDEGLVLPR